MTKLTKSINKFTHDRHRITPMITDMMTDIMTAMMTDMMTDRMVTNQDSVMVTEKKEIENMKTMVLREKDIDPPVDMILGNQKGIQIALKVQLKNKWMKLSKVQLTS